MTETPLGLAAKGAEALRARGIDNARLEAELLLAHVLGVKRLDLYLQHERPLVPNEVDAYRTMIRRRRTREPLQYIVGSVGFRRLTLRVDRRALIPRPETEVLVDVVLRWAAERATTPSAGGGGLTALDIGTGTGAIALSLLAEGPFAHVVATDVSAEALALARENGEACGLTARLELRLGATWTPIDAGERFDVIVSNPPYVGTEEADQLQPEVRDWEPASALYAGPGGLEVLEPLIEGAAARLAPGGLLALEIGAEQAERVANLVGARAELREVQVVADLAGRPRVVTAARAAVD